MKKLILVLGILMCILFIAGCSQEFEKSSKVEAGTFLPYSIKLNKGEVVHINIESDKNMTFFLMDLKNYDLFKEDDKNYDIFVGSDCSQFAVKRLDCNFKAYEDGKYYIVLINFEDTAVNVNIKLEKIDGENLIIPPKKTQEMQGSTQILSQKESLKALKVHVTIIKNDMDKLSEISNNYEDIETAYEYYLFVAEITPRLNIYKTHLKEYKDFLNSEKNVFLGKEESIQQVIQQVDERIVEVDTIINRLNVLTEQYNKQEIEEILKIMKHMDGEI